MSKESTDKITTQPIITPLELFKLIREQIQHEDNLVNQRLTWLLIAHGFLFAGMIQIEIQNTNTTTVLPIQAVALIISSAGILINAASFVGLRAAHRSLTDLYQTWENAKSKDSRLGSSFPQITWRGDSRLFRAINTAKATPIIIMALWSLLDFVLGIIVGIATIIGLSALIIGVIALLLLGLMCFETFIEKDTIPKLKNENNLRRRK